MVIQNIENQLLKFRKYTNYEIECPICKEKMNIGVELGDLNNVKNFPFTHILVHGEPIHAIITYIDSQFKVRGVEGSQLIKFEKSSNIVKQIIEKWSNPF